MPSTVLRNIALSSATIMMAALTPIESYAQVISPLTDVGTPVLLNPVPAQDANKLKITLLGIQDLSASSHQAYTDIKIDQRIYYKPKNKLKRNRDIENSSIVLMQPKNRLSQSGLPYIVPKASGESTTPLRIQKGEMKDINNAITFGLTPNEMGDETAQFYLMTNLSELHNCTARTNKSCEKIQVSNARRNGKVKVDIYDVIKRLKSTPSKQWR